MDKTGKLILIILLSSAASLALSGLFVPNGPARWTAALLGALLLAPSAVFRMSRREERVRKEQCGFLFQILLSRVSVGDTLDTAFMAAGREVGLTWGTRSPVAVPLRGLASDLESRTPFSQAIIRFTRKLRCPEAESVLTALASSRFIGTGIMELLRTGQRMVMESLTAADDVEAETAQRRTEAMAIAAMPPLVAVLLRKLAPGYLDPVLSSPSGAWIMAGAYILSALSMALILRILAGPATVAATRRSHAGSVDKRTSVPAVCILLARRLPTVYRSRLDRALDRSGETDPDRIARHLGRKILLALSGAAVGLLLARAGGTWIYVPALAIVLPVLQDRDLLRKAARMQQRLLHNFPVFLGLMAAILFSGVSLSNALELCAASLPDPDGPFGQEIAGIRAATRAGQSASAGFDRLSARMAIPEIQASLSLLAQYERTGGRELVSLLRMQVPACWSLYRNAIRKQMEEYAVRLLIPMTLDLIAVIALTGLPAMLTFQG